MKVIGVNVFIAMKVTGGYPDKHKDDCIVLKAKEYLESV